METITRNLEELVAFHAVATEGSFTAAAAKLGTSKAMLSKQVKRLETYMKVQLFHRTTRRLSLTENGLALLNYSRKIIDLSNEATRRLRDFSQGSTGLIRMTAPVSLGEIIFPSLVSVIRIKLPHVSVEIDLSNEQRDINGSNVDFALRASPVEHPELVVRRLGRIKDVICASPNFLRKVKIDPDPSKLIHQECIRHSLKDAWNQWTFSSAGGDLRVEANGKMSTNQYTIARLLCLGGIGIARIPYYMVEKDLENGDLVELFREYLVATHQLNLVYLRNEYATHKHKVVKGLIFDWFAENKKYFV